MASRSQTEFARPGDILLVVHEFQARSPDELSLARGDRIELIERDDDFGDGWFLGKNTENSETGLFPEVYTRPAPKPTINVPVHQRNPSQPMAELRPLQHATPPGTAVSEPATIHTFPSPEPSPVTQQSLESPPPHPEQQTSPLQLSNPIPTPPPATTPSRTSISTTPQRSISMTLSGDIPREDDTIGSPVMHETLSVIDEHITDMSTPRHSIVAKDLRGNDSGSEYSSHHRLSYINGHETEDEEQTLHTEAEVMGWSPERVAEYLEDVGVEKKHCDIFREQEINGEVLLGMDQATIFLKEFELGPVGPRLRTWLKVKALQQEVKTVHEARKNVTSFDGVSEESQPDPIRNRATSMGAVLPRIPSLKDGQSPKPPPKSLPRANSTAGHSPVPIVEATSPLVHATPSSPGPVSRPSAASVRSMNHSRRHSSIDYNINPQAPPKVQPNISTPHKKTPSFDRNWSMGSPQKASHELNRPSSSNHMHSSVIGGMEYDPAGVGPALSPLNTAELDRGYFSGNEVDNRKARNVLRKKDSPSHSRNPSYSTETGRRSTFSRRHSRLGSSDSAAGSTSPISPAAKAYYGSSIKSHRSSSNFEFIRPSKATTEVTPTVTRLEYDSPSIDAIAKSPHVPGSETSSQGRASPSPATHSFFSKKPRGSGLRAISDAITGTERASAGDMTGSPLKESPMQSPTRTGSSTPSGASMSRSFDFENPDLNKRLTAASTGSKQRKAKKHGTSAYLRGRETITPQEAMMACDYSGWMKKKSSSLMTTWKTRLFVLRGRRLSYFYTENDTEEKGLIDISSHRVLPANNERMTGLHASLTRASSSPTSPQNATIPTNASTDVANGIEEDMSGMFIFKLVPPRAGLQKGVQFTKPIVHYFAVDSIQIGRLWMAALMKATIDRDETLNITTTYQQKTISLEKARAMRQRPPALMDEEEDEAASSGKRSKESVLDEVIQEEDEKHGLAISGLDDAKALLDFAENGPGTPPAIPPKRKESVSGALSPGLVSPIG
ncbi:hypothetical protein BU24DRAFT_156859 [Aaosphaeria arxii CBS 175.79]|uniref:Polarized growth protein Boi2 n=1 Tax=Aaosphaeria arxii CBS 175.79 TaxID=1450172 RepID=A0A6A5XZL0_9PLEO|nr:uncharacterized protein BU24DRAFT_156859 [Aaosphaeria arxii CBS 175.79]KAF2017714.1 hypothetical protein BU24DRAFT_156859 [Aaosphaeria arxii CBS 175.79]